MFKLFFKTTWRNLWKDKAFSFLNIAGLAIGIACAALIFLWVENEINWDQFNVNKDRLYFVNQNQEYEDYTRTIGSTPGLLGPAIQAEIPGIANTCRMSQGQTSLLFSIGDKNMYASGNYAEPSLFSMFTLPFVQGNAQSAFSQLHSIVITEKTAKKFFGDETDVLGKKVRVDHKQDYVVTGVLKDLPENSSLQFEWIMPFRIYFQQTPRLHTWGNNSLSTYVELKPGVDPAAINRQLDNFIQERDPQSVSRPFLFNMNRWHLYNQFENGKQTGGGRITYVRLFSIIAWIILFIACINFMNLSTARSEKRAKEIGVRKVLGAGKRKLFAQFMGEALLMSVLSALCAVEIISLVLPAFDALVGEHLSLGLANPVHLLAMLAITLVCGLVAGSYPSLYLSSFNPISVLKGLKMKSNTPAMTRKGLVVVQFSVSVILIICTMIIYRQIQHVKDRNLGFNKNNLLQTDVVGNLAKHYSFIKQDLLNTGVVKNVALSDHVTLNSGNTTGDLTWDGKTTNAEIPITFRNVTPDFIKTSGMQILEGRDFEPGDSIRSNKFNVIITKSFARLMGDGSAVGKTIGYDDSSGRIATVVGVVDNYVYGNISGTPGPVMFICTAPTNTTKMYIRMKPTANVAAALTQIQGVMKKDNPAYPFDYQFVDDQFNQMFTSEMLISRLSRLFAILAILISCLGLFGLSAYMAERRTKEVGIRKTLGASVTGIVSLLSKDFLKLVGIGFLVAVPVAWYVMHRWLENFAYHISISAGIFVLAGILAMIIALGTVSWQSVKAAIANPVESLRSE